MAIELVVHHLRRAWRWSLVSTLFATAACRLANER
jgi:hypothetical protein